MITKSHNVACRVIMNAISNVPFEKVVFYVGSDAAYPSTGSLAGCIVHMDAGSTDRFAQQNLQIYEHANNGTLPIWLFDARLSVRDRLTSSRPDAILATPLLNLNHLPLPTCNRCSMLLDLMDKCAELTSLTLLIRGSCSS